MRKLIFILFIVFSNQAISQFHFRLFAGRTFGEIQTGNEGSYDYDGYSFFQLGGHYYNCQVREEVICNYTNTARIGVGLKYSKKSFFAEFNPTFDLSSFKYRHQSWSNYSLFNDEAHLLPVPESEILASGWPVQSQYTEEPKKHDVFAIGLNFSMGYQITSKHSIKLSICETRMPMNQFGSDVDWDDTDKRFVSSGDYSYYEIFTNRSCGLIYEYSFAKNCFVNIQPSIPIKVLDQKRGDFFMALKQTPFVNVNIGVQFPNKSEKTKRSKVDKKSDTPKIL
jgi:hypothetical protein